MSVKKFMFLLGFVVFGISMIFLFQSQLNPVQAQDSKPKVDSEKVEEINANIKIDDFCNALKKHDLNLLRTCFAVGHIDFLKLQTDEIDEFFSNAYEDLFDEDGALFEFMKGKNNDIDFRVIEIIQYKYDLSAANDLAKVKFEFKFKYGADKDIHTINFESHLINLQNLWYINTGKRGLDDYFENLSEKLEDIIKPARKSYRDYPRDESPEEGEETPWDEPAEGETYPEDPETPDYPEEPAGE